MIEPSTSCNERQRLDALERLRILDTPSEQRFDRYTRLAQKLFNVPIALISLIDRDRQWFKSRVGLDAIETPRDISFCGHTILQKEPFVINDATKDHRFFDNPFVIAEPGIRFYAGAPLVLANQMRVGTLCIIDTQVRTLGREALDSLKDIADMVADEFTVHIDTLTGLVNRRGLGVALENLEEANTSGAGADNLSMIMFDLDRFKEINDQFGHQIGDDALQLFSNYLIKIFRRTDVLSRFGGDEFCILLPDTTLSVANKRVERLREEINAFNLKNVDSYQIEFSAGVYSTTDRKNQMSMRQVIDEVDQLLYADKKQRHTNL